MFDQLKGESAENQWFGLTENRRDLISCSIR